MAQKVVTLYYADWCGHCQSLKPEWAVLEQKIIEKNKEGYNIICVKKEEREMTEDEKAKIEGYPTIIITNGDVTVQYQGSRTSQAILDAVLSDAITSSLRGGGRSKTHSHYGKDSDAYYKMKYLKYKAKYFKLRSK